MTSLPHKVFLNKTIQLHKKGKTVIGTLKDVESLSRSFGRHGGRGFIVNCMAVFTYNTSLSEDTVGVNPQ